MLRAVLTLAGSYLVGHSIAGHKIDDNLWQLIGGAAVTIASTVWGILDKAATIEGLQSAIRSIVTAVGGVFLALGIAFQQTLDSLMSMTLVLVPLIQSYISKVKVKQLDSGKIMTTASGKVAPASPQPR